MGKMSCAPAGASPGHPATRERARCIPSPSFPSNDFESQKLFNLAIFPVCRDRRDCIVDLLLSSRKDDPAGALWLMTLGASQ